jgi:murein DD-endopeptidase MepM/ murein hydrolase activator NlpD
VVVVSTLLLLIANDATADGGFGGTAYQTRPSPPGPRAPAVRIGLRRGRRGPAVVALQTALAAQGFPTSRSGVFGHQTERSLRRFQRSLHLRPTGVVDRATSVALGSVGKASVVDAGFVFPIQPVDVVADPGAWTLDQGVDVGTMGERCGPDAPEVAVADAVVVRLGIDGFGPDAPVLRLTRGSLRGRYVYYGHARPALVHVGDKVAAGQPIADVGCGRVGRSSAPHLEIGISAPRAGPCCPAVGVTAPLMRAQLLLALARAVGRIVPN